MAMSKCRECGKAVSTLAKTCPNCGVSKPVKKIKKVVRKKNTLIKSKAMMDLMCANSNCNVWLHPVNVPHQVDISFYKCPRCNQSMKKYSDKVAEDDRRRIQGIKHKIQNDKIHSAVSRSIENTKLKDFTSTNQNSSAVEKNVYDKFADGNLDLATAFWLFGILGSFAGSLILTLLAESVSKIFYFPFVGLNAFIIIALWECAENYKKEKLQKKQSAVWGYLTQVFCVVGGLGLISTVYDIIKTL